MLALGVGDGLGDVRGPVAPFGRGTIGRALNGHDSAAVVLYGHAESTEEVDSMERVRHVAGLSSQWA